LAPGRRDVFVQARVEPIAADSRSALKQALNEACPWVVGAALLAAMRRFFMPKRRAIQG
jgi:hypothetical protein